MDKKILMPESLTAENGAKMLLIGEFFVEFEVTDNDGDTYDEREPIPWTTIKEIYAMAAKHLGEPVKQSHLQAQRELLDRVEDLFYRSHLSHHTPHMICIPTDKWKEIFTEIEKIKAKLGEDSGSK